MKQSGHCAGIRIDARKVGSFVRIAAVACQRKSGFIVGTAMLPWHNVSTWKAMRGVAHWGSRQYSHASPARSRTMSRVRRSTLCSLTREKPAGLCLHYGDNVDSLDKVLVVRILFGRERSLIRLPAQFLDARLDLRIRVKVQNSGCGFGRQCVRKGVRQSVQISRHSRHAVYPFLAVSSSSPGVAGLKSYGGKVQPTDRARGWIARGPGHPGII